MGTGTCRWCPPAAADAGRASPGRTQVSRARPRLQAPEAADNGASASSLLSRSAPARYSTGSSSRTTRAREEARRRESVEGETDRQSWAAGGMEEAEQPGPVRSCLSLTHLFHHVHPLCHCSCLTVNTRCHFAVLLPFMLALLLFMYLGKTGMRKLSGNAF